MKTAVVLLTGLAALLGALLVGAVLDLRQRSAMLRACQSEQIAEIETSLARARQVAASASAR